MSCEVYTQAVKPYEMTVRSGQEFPIAVKHYSPCHQEAILIVETSQEDAVDLEYRDNKDHRWGEPRGDSVGKAVTLDPQQDHVGVILAMHLQTGGPGATPTLNVYFVDEDGGRLSNDIPVHHRTFVYLIAP